MSNIHKKFFIFSLFLINTFVYSQERTVNPKNPDDVNIKIRTQQEPFFPGGDQALFTYFYNNIKYSDDAKAKKINGDVLLSFYVMPDSTLADIKMLSGVDEIIDSEVIRVLSQLKYAPGIQNNTKTKMNVILTVPVKAH